VGRARLWTEEREKVIKTFSEKIVFVREGGEEERNKKKHY
jgi:hypothetical protein